MVNRTVTLSRKREMGEGYCINWKVQCSFVSLQTEDETQGKSWLTSLEMSEREVWAQVACDPGSSALGTRAVVPAQFCQGQQTNQTGWDGALTWPCQQSRLSECFGTEATSNLV